MINVLRCVFGLTIIWLALFCLNIKKQNEFLKEVNIIRAENYELQNKILYKNRELKTLRKTVHTRLSLVKEGY